MKWITSVRFTLNPYEKAMIYFTGCNAVSTKNIANKMVIGLDSAGVQQTIDYPLITAKVYFLGNKDRGVTIPLDKGDEGIILFNDREIESWFINGEINNLSYDRSHHITDAIFLVGMHSQPKMLNFVADCINLWYNDTYIRLSENNIAMNGDTNITGDVAITGNQTITETLTVTNGISDLTGATGSFVSQDNKSISVENGIVKSIS